MAKAKKKKKKPHRMDAAKLAAQLEVVIAQREQAKPKGEQLKIRTTVSEKRNCNTCKYMRGLNYCMHHKINVRKFNCCSSYEKAYVTIYLGGGCSPR